MQTELVSQLAQTGLLGLLLAISIGALVKKDSEVKEAKKEFTEYLLKNGEKDGETKTQLTNALNNLTNAVSQKK